jgi:hypothetical protein
MFKLAPVQNNIFVTDLETSPYCVYRFIALCGRVLLCECVYVSVSEQSYREHPFLQSDLFLFLQQESRRQEKQLYPSDKLDYAERNVPLLWTRLI